MSRSSCLLVSRRLPMRGIVAVAFSAAACYDGTGPPSSTAVRLEAMTATSVTGTVGAEIGPVPAVRATDGHGHAVAGVDITFRLGSGGGAIANSRATTGADGSAGVGKWTLGRAPGSHTLTASAAGPAEVVFTATAGAGPPARLAPLGGNDQAASVGENLPQPLRAQVTDSFGNPVRGAPVTFTVISGAGSIDGGVAVADANGAAESGPWTLGPTSGVQQVRAASGAADMTFSAIAIGPPGELQGRLVYVSEIEGNSDLYVVNADGSGRTRLTTHTESDVSPAWSPNGSEIAFASDRTGRRSIYTMTADGANVRRLVDGGSPAWSPDGLSLAFASPDGIAALDLSDGSVDVLRAGPGYIGEPAWSPDGRRLAYVSDFVAYDFTYDIYTMNADGTGETRLTQGFDLGPRGIRFYLAPAWSPDAGMIAFVYGAYVKERGEQRDMRLTVALMSPAGVMLKELAWAGDFPWDESLDPKTLAWSPDGSGIAYTFFDCDVLTGSGCSRQRSVKYVSLDGSLEGTIVSNGHSPSWRR